MKKILMYLTARSRVGINCRLWLAVVVSTAALLVNIFYIKEEYDHLPAIVPHSFDMFGEVAEWGHRSLISDYAEVRIVFFLIMLLIGWILCKLRGGSLLGQRIRLLVVDIANLVITTGISMTLVYIEIAKGDTTQKLSEHWEYIVMLFWLLILVIEYITDRKYIK